MSLIPHHTSDPVCALCDLKLEQAHPFMLDWFRRVKAKYPNAHISWTYRDKIAQEQAFLDHRTHDHFPNSPHNRENPETKLPESLAIDLFQIDEDGVALFSPKFYLSVAQDCKAEKSPIKWGGEFKTLGDYDHFQYVPAPVASIG